MSLPTVMKHEFSKVPQVGIQRSKFDRSHGLKTTFDAGYLVPIYVDEALPGDTFNMRMSAFARLATPIKPVMDNMYLDTFFFAVPIRLIWNNWEKFNGAQDDPGDTTDYTVPTIPIPNGGPEVGSLHDYLGIPTDIGTGFSVASLWHRAYNLIWNTWFRDQNLQDSVVVDKDDGPDTLADYVLLKRGKRHDYFTSALPWPQKGDDVLLPLGTTAPVDGSGDTIASWVPTGSNATRIRLAASPYTLVTGDNADWLGVEDDASGKMQYDTAGTPTDVIIDPNGRLRVSNEDIASGLTVDLAGASAVTINALREALQLQVLLERDARGGTRYTEILRSHFGVVSPDARLQRPEYLGGGSSPINIHPVPQTTATASPTLTNAQGNLAAFGTASFNGHGFNKAFVEHCVLIGLANVRADLTYQQGLNRMFSRSTRYDFYWPALANLGEQAILNKEIYIQGTAADDDVFGYQERYAEYRYKPSQVTGAFRSTYATSLDYWHLSQEFTALPTLGATFIAEDPPVDRVIAVTTEPHIMFDAYFKLICARPMPVYAVPTLGDRL